MINLKFLNHAEHGYLEVPLTLLDKVDYIPTMFSCFDVTTKLCYLEEDCDAPRFLKKAEEIGLKVNIIEKSVSVKPTNRVTCERFKGENKL
jgi:hypothetical protein